MNLPDDYTIRLVDMPVTVGGFVSECPDGHVDVYINARLSHDGQYGAAEHEFEHWENDDLNNDKDIREVEGAANVVRLARASDLPRPGKRHDAAEMRIRQERMDDWKNDVYLNMGMHGE